MILVLLAIMVSGASLEGQNLRDGISALEAGRLEVAAQTLSEVVRQQPDSAEACYYLGLAHFRADRPAAARPLLERAVTLSPTSGRAWKLLGLVTTSVG